MKRVYSLKNTASFSYIRRKSKGVDGKYTFLKAVPAGSLKLGISVSKKVGGAVERNLLKRRIKEIFVQNVDKLGMFNILITLKVGSIDASYAQLKEDVESLFEKSHLFAVL